MRKEIREEMPIIIGMTLEFEVCLNWFRSFFGGRGSGDFFVYVVYGCCLAKWGVL